MSMGVLQMIQEMLCLLVWSPDIGIRKYKTGVCVRTRAHQHSLSTCWVAYQVNIVRSIEIGSYLSMT